MSPTAFFAVFAIIAMFIWALRMRDSDSSRFKKGAPATSWKQYLNYFDRRRDNDDGVGRGAGRGRGLG